MKQHLPILRSKLTPPNIAHALVRKPLVDRLETILQKKLGTVIAGAGYGKSTLVAQLAEKLEGHVIWYRLDETDADFSVFMSYLIAGIQKRVPRFGNGLIEQLSFPKLSPKNKQNLLFEFLATIEQTISDHITFILDDFYLVDTNKEIADMLTFLVDRSPSTLHLVIISRIAPIIKLSRYRAIQQLVELDEMNLAFSEEEIQHLFHHVLGVEINRSLSTDLFDKTGGWAAGLILFYHAQRTSATGKMPETSFTISRPPKIVFEYIEENIFAGLPVDIQKFMVATSLLETLDSDFCNTMLGRTDAAAILKTLCERHLLTFSIGDEFQYFQYHHLLQEFLRHKLIQKGYTDNILDLHYKIAVSFENEGNLQKALHHFIEGKHFDDARRLFTRMVFKDFLDCPFKFLLHAFDKLPLAYIQGNARLLHLRARLFSLKGNLPEAIKDIQAALRHFQKAHDEGGIAACQKDLGFHYYLTGDVIKARDELSRIWGESHNDPFFQVEVAGHLVLFSAILGQMEAADQYFHTMKARLSTTGRTGNDFFVRWMDLCYSNRCHNSGNFNRAIELTATALNSFRSMQMEALLPIANFQMALTLFYQHEFEKGLSAAKKGIQIADRLGITDHQYAWLLYARGLNAYGVNQLDDATEDATAAYHIFKTTGHPWGKATAYELLGLICCEQQDPKAAEHHFKEGLQWIDGRGLFPCQGSLSLNLTQVFLEKGNVKLAEVLLARIKKEIDFSAFLRFRYHLLQSRCLAMMGQNEAAKESIFSALKLSRQYHYTGWLLKAFSWSAATLLDCHADGTMPDYIEQLFQQNKANSQQLLLDLRRIKTGPNQRAASALRQLLPKADPPPLRVKCLGSFKVTLNGRALSASHWRNNKAMTIFKYLALKRKHGAIPKEVLLELAWPEEDIRKTNRRLHVALNFLRKQLEPDLKRGIPSSYILRHHGGYQLTIGTDGRIDVEDFSTAVGAAEKIEIEAPEKALTIYKDAESIYGGPLFEEDPYQDWFAEERERFHTIYLRSLSKIIQINEQNHAWEAAIHYAEKYLTVDKYAEPVYCALMRCHSAIGNTSWIKSTFKQCEKVVTEDLACPLSDTTIGLFRSLVEKR